MLTGFHGFNDCLQFTNRLSTGFPRFSGAVLAYTISQCMSSAACAYASADDICPSQIERSSASAPARARACAPQARRRPVLLLHELDDILQRHACPHHAGYFATSERVHTCKRHGRDERFSHQLSFGRGFAEWPQARNLHWMI